MGWVFHRVFFGWGFVGFIGRLTGFTDLESLLGSSSNRRRLPEIGLGLIGSEFRVGLPKP